MSITNPGPEIEPECVLLHLTDGTEFECTIVHNQFLALLTHSDGLRTIDVDRPAGRGLDVAGKTGVHPDTPQEALVALLGSGDVRITTGSPEDFALFFSYFEAPSTEPLSMTIR